MAVTIPMDGVSSSAGGDSRKGERRLFNHLFNGLYARILGPEILVCFFFTASCP